MKYLLIIVPLLVLTTSTVAQTDPALRDELLKMREADQRARAACQGTSDEQLKCLAETLEKVDKPNTARINEIYGRSGFPTAETVGKDGVEAFLLILQHSPDEQLRRKNLKNVGKAFRRREITPMEYAGYVDRVRVRRNKPQLYGSNFDMKEGRLVMSAVKDRRNLNRRRRKLGLPTIEEYAAKLREVYKLEVVVPPAK
ncbi:MAG TPA: DUF6624 domain-containing protein [Pyrinomonadaceae bacterium]|jgi:hypothetical protein